MNHRLRHAMATEGVFAQLDGVVEADETYIGARRKRGTKRGRPGAGSHKVPVFALVQRGGKVRAFPMPRVTADTLRASMKQHMSPKATLMTDEYAVYNKLGKEFAKHERVNHAAGEYVRGEAHKITAEGFFSLLKRGLNGSFHHVSKGHLFRYVDEFAFRYNNRAARGIQAPGYRAELRQFSLQLIQNQHRRASRSMTRSTLRGVAKRAKKKKDEPLRIPLEFEDALRLVLKVKPIKKARKKR